MPFNLPRFFLLTLSLKFEFIFRVFFPRKFNQLTIKFSTLYMEYLIFDKFNSYIGRFSIKKLIFKLLTDINSLLNISRLNQNSKSNP